MYFLFFSLSSSSSSALNRHNSKIVHNSVWAGPCRFVTEFDAGQIRTDTGIEDLEREIR